MVYFSFYFNLKIVRFFYRTLYLNMKYYGTETHCPISLFSHKARGKLPAEEAPEIKMAKLF
jgi:hypothetical protein